MEEEFRDIDKKYLYGFITASGTKLKFLPGKNRVAKTKAGYTIYSEDSESLKRAAATISMQILGIDKKLLPCIIQKLYGEKIDRRSASKSVKDDKIKYIKRGNPNKVGGGVGYDTPEFRKFVSDLIGRRGIIVFNSNIKQQILRELMMEVDDGSLDIAEVDALDDLFLIGEKNKEITVDDINKFISELDKYSKDDIWGIPFYYNFVEIKIEKNPDHLYTQYGIEWKWDRYTKKSDPEKEDEKEDEKDDEKEEEPESTYKPKKGGNCVERSGLELREHQKAVIKHFEKNRGLIAIHGVGTGKTLTAVTASQCFLDKYPKSKVIVVTPTSLQANFKKEMKRYDPKINMDKYEFYTLDGFSRASNKGEVMCKDRMLIIDEAHNMRTKITFNRAGELKGGKRALALQNCAALDSAKRVLLLTATPIVNKEYDIENLISMVEGRMPLSEKEFWKKLGGKAFAEYFKCKISMYNPDALQKGADYPEFKIHDIYIGMPTFYETEYQRIEDAIKELKGTTKKGEKAELGAFFVGLRQASNKLDDEVDSPKIVWLKNFLDTHPRGKIVMFSHWLDAGLSAIKKVLTEKDIDYAHIDGSIPVERRKQAVEKYNNEEIRVLLISKAGGEGLDLKATRYMILMDPGWNPATAEQVIGRGIRYKSHTHLPKSEQFVDIYKLFLVKSAEDRDIKAGKPIPTIDEMKYAADSTGYVYAVDLYMRQMAGGKDTKIDEFIERLRPYSIEKQKC